MKETKIIIKSQGAPVINTATVLIKNKDLTLIGIDCKSKYCELDGYIGGGKDCLVYIGANENSIKLKKGKKITDSTLIILPEFSGWEVIASNNGRYSITIVLKRNKK
jgi:hypothetical protein